MILECLGSSFFFSVMFLRKKNEGALFVGLFMRKLEICTSGLRTRNSQRDNKFGPFSD